MASGFWNGIGNRSSVTINVNDDGVVSLVEGNPDIGGTRATIAMQAAEILGLPAEDVHPAVADTDAIGYNDLTAGSRTTYASGQAAIEAARLVVEEMKKRMALIWETGPENVEFENGVFRNKVAPDQRFAFKQAAGKLGQTGGPRRQDRLGQRARLRRRQFRRAPRGRGSRPGDRQNAGHPLHRAQDAGKAVHPSYVEGQFQGGAAQGVGWALNEEYYTDEDGVMLNSSFLDYRMPTALDLPMLDTIIVETPNANHPFGVRGIGETSIVPPAPAVANAIADAIGARLYQTPMNPARVMEALAAKRNGANGR